MPKEEHISDIISLIKMEEDLDVIKYLIRVLANIDSDQAEVAAHELLADPEIITDIKDEIVNRMAKQGKTRLLHKLLEDWDKKAGKSKKAILQALLLASDKKHLTHLEKILKSERDQEVADEIKWIMNELNAL